MRINEQRGIFGPFIEAQRATNGRRARPPMTRAGKVTSLVVLDNPRLRRRGVRTTTAAATRTSPLPWRYR